MDRPYKIQKLNSLHTKIYLPPKMNPNPREIGWTESSESDDDVDVEEAHDVQANHNPRNPPGHRPVRAPVVEFEFQYIDMSHAF